MMTTMPEFETNVRIRAPLAVVFAALSNPDEYVKCLSKVRRVEWLDGTAPALNASYREWRELPDGKEAVQDFRFTAFEPGKSYTIVSTSAGIRFTFAASFEANGDETEVTVRASARGATVAGKLLLPLVWLFAGSFAKKSLTEDLAGMKECLERAGAD